MTPRKSTPAKATPARKTTAPRRSPRAARPAAAAVEEPRPVDIIEPVIIGKAKGDDAPVETVTLFELDDVPYQIPRNPSAGLVLSWIVDAGDYGRPAANQRMALELLGAAALQALRASPHVKPEHINKIFGNLGTVFFESENYAEITGAADPS